MTTPLLDLWLQAFPVTDASRAVASEYLQRIPTEADPAVLRQLLATSAAGSGTGTAPSPAASLAEQVKADFVSGDVVEVRGWVLSRTEARLAALSHLLP